MSGSPARRGFSVLGLVLFFGMVTSSLVFAYHGLWRGGSRTMYSVQEHRQLINIARSALGEAYFELQGSLDRSKAEWFDWFTAPGGSPDQTFVPSVTRTNIERMVPDAGALQYTTSDVAIERVIALDPQAGGGAMGIVDLRVIVSVERTSPRHVARMVMIERRNYWLADDLGPFGSAGRHVEISPTPIATTLEEDPE